MNCSYVLFDMRGVTKFATTYFTLEIPLFLMNSFNMDLNMTFRVGFIITLFTFELPFILMNSFNMQFKILFRLEVIVTLLAFELPSILMNRSYVKIQATLPGKRPPTLSASKVHSFFMNSSYMYSQMIRTICRKITCFTLECMNLFPSWSTLRHVFTLDAKQQLKDTNT